MSHLSWQGLEWGLKASFRAYVEAVDDHRVEMDGVTTLQGNYLFPLVSSGEEEGDTVHRFSGGLRIRAHRGILRVVMENPEVRITDDKALLTVEVETGSRVAICELAAQAPDGDSSSRLFHTRLLPDGVTLFGEVYSAGTMMDPIRLKGLSA